MSDPAVNPPGGAPGGGTGAGARQARGGGGPVVRGIAAGLFLVAAVALLAPFLADEPGEDTVGTSTATTDPQDVDTRMPVTVPARQDTAPTQEQDAAAALEARLAGIEAALAGLAPGLTRSEIDRMLVERLDAALAAVPPDPDPEPDEPADPARDAAPGVVVDRPATPDGDGLAGPAGVAPPAGPAGGAGVPAREISRDEAFLAAAFAAGTARVRAAPIGDPARTLAEGTVLSATLETALDTSLPGPARALLARDVRSWDGSAVLLPAGTRLIGSYDARISIAQRRVAVAWTRAIRPDGIAIALGGVGADRLGRAGATGDIDTRLVERFGGALLVSLIDAAPEIARAALAGDRNRDGRSRRGEQDRNGVADVNVNVDVTNDLAGDTARAAGQAFQPLINDYLRLPPVIRIAPGTRLSILVTRDLAFPSGVRGVRPLRPLAGAAPLAGVAPVAGARP